MENAERYSLISDAPSWREVYHIRQTFCIETGDDPDEHSLNKLERKSQKNGDKQTDQVSAAKTRLVND